MTVAATTPLVTYLGNGSTNLFPFSFQVFLGSQLTVTVQAPAPDSTIYNLQYGVDYTVSGLSPTGNPAMPGSITLTNQGQIWLNAGNLLSNYTLTILRNVPLSQTSSIRNQGDYLRSYLEDALDTLEMQIQQLAVAPQAAALQPVLSSGVFLIDQVTLATYQIFTVNGVLSSQQVTSPNASPSIIVLADTINGHTYQLQMINGALQTTQVT